MIAIVKYNGGNVRSVMNALERIGKQAEWTADPERIHSASHVILPGVGQAGAAMDSLQGSGMQDLIPTLTQPVLGICLGMQLFCSSTEEGDVKGLGVFPARVSRFSEQLQIPHMGWNTIESLKGPLFQGIPEGSHMYFVHGFKAEITAQTTASTEYGVPFSAAFQNDNWFGVQFHPEKSALPGERILQNFISL